MPLSNVSIVDFKQVNVSWAKLKLGGHKLDTLDRFIISDRCICTQVFAFFYITSFFLHIFSNITFLTAYLCVQSYRKFVKEYILFDNNVLEAILGDPNSRSSSAALFFNL